MLPKFRPLGDRVLVRQSEEKAMSEGGLYIPPSAQEKPHQGEVLAVGPGRKLEDGSVVEPSVKAGDVVLFGKYSGTQITVGDGEYLVMPESDILGIVDRKD